jgi:hypothetical protein
MSKANARHAINALLQDSSTIPKRHVLGENVALFG